MRERERRLLSFSLSSDVLVFLRVFCILLFSSPLFVFRLSRSHLVFLFALYLLFLYLLLFFLAFRPAGSSQSAIYFLARCSVLPCLLKQCAGRKHPRYS